MKKWISITTGVLHLLFAGLLIAWIAGDWDVPDKKWAMIPSAVLLAVNNPANKTCNTPAVILIHFFM